MQIGDKGYYTIKESDILLHKISPRKHITPDIVELKAKENVIVIGTSADGIHVKQRGSDKTKCEKDKTKCEKEKNAKNSADGGKEVTDGPDEKVDLNIEESNKENIIDEKGTAADDEFEDLEDDGSDTGSESDSVKSGPGSPALRKKNRKRTSVLSHGFKRVRGKKAKKRAHHTEREVKPGDRVPIEIWYTFSTCSVMWQVKVLFSNFYSSLHNFLSLASNEHPILFKFCPTLSIFYGILHIIYQMMSLS